MTARAGTVWFIVESGTDARMVEGLALRTNVQVLARGIGDGRAISQPTAVPVTIAGSGRVAFAWIVFQTLLRAGSWSSVLVQGHGLAAFAANAAARLKRRPSWMLVCSPYAEYYRARRLSGDTFSPFTLAAIVTLSRLNGLLGQGYVVLGRYLADVVRPHARGKAIEVIPVYGVDTRRFTPSSDRASARRQRGLPPSGRIIFSSSRDAPEKDSATLLEAFAHLVGRGLDVHLLHRSGRHREFLEHARRVGVAHRVIATDAVDPRSDLALDYIAADVCVQVSRAEGLGFSVLEALACGTPVVATATGGLLETIREGETGWSVPTRDARALAAAIADALDRPDEARRRTTAGAAMVREQFEADPAFDRLAGILDGHRRDA